MKNLRDFYYNFNIIQQYFHFFSLYWYILYHRQGIGFIIPSLKILSLWASLDVQKITINRTVNAGDQVMFEIVVHNLGQVDLTNVVVREDTFTGLVYDSFIDYDGVWTKNGDLSWNLTTPLRAGEYEGFFVRRA